MVRTAEIRRAASSAEIADAHRQQRQSDGHDDQRSDQRRKQLAQRLDEIAEDELHHAADDACADDRAIPRAGTDHAGRGDEAGAGAHDDRQPRTELPHRIQLQQCRDGCDEHRILDQRCAQIKRDVQQSADDHQRRDVGQEHGQHMLDAQRKRTFQRYSSFEFVDRPILLVFFLFLLHFLSPFAKKPRVATRTSMRRNRRAHRWHNAA